MLKQLSQYALMAFLMATLAACANQSKTEQDAAEEGEGGVVTSSTDDGSLESSSNEGSDLEAYTGGSSLADLDESEIKDLLKTSVLYFGFDRFSAAGKNVLVAKAHGKYLSENPNSRVRVEGHADERGTREYNIALGERRAKSIKQVLLSSGAQSRQIEVVSYGEESPAMDGSTEEAWAKNRRVEIEYTSNSPR